MGPVPEDYYDNLTWMEQNEHIRIRQIPTAMRNAMELIEPISEPDLSIFSDKEIKTLYAVLGRWGDAFGTDMSEESHKEFPWLITDEGEKVPYQLALHRSAEAITRDPE